MCAEENSQRPWDHAEWLFTLQWGLGMCAEENRFSIIPHGTWRARQRFERG
jgi:hypothetical protein